MDCVNLISCACGGNKAHYLEIVFTSCCQVYLPSYSLIFFLQTMDEIQLISYHDGTVSTSLLLVYFSKQVAIICVRTYHPSNKNMLLLSAKYKHKFCNYRGGKSKARNWTTVLISIMWNYHYGSLFISDQKCLVLVSFK